MSNLHEQYPTFEELVDHAAGIVLQQLLVGKLKTGVYFAMDMAIRWSQEKK